MSLKIFQEKEFETPHEREFFEELINKLILEYGDEQNLYLLLGNFNCSGNAIDALFLKSDSIIIFDFKNYNGDLSFKENGSWFVNEVKVKAGNFSNPYEQLKQYRNDVFNKLKSVLKYIDDPLLRKLIKSSVLFHSSISIKSAPKDFFNRNPWFKITDQQQVNNCINNLTTTGVNLTHQQIISIPEALGIPERKERKALRNTTTHDVDLKTFFTLLIEFHNKNEILDLLDHGFNKIIKQHDAFINHFYSDNEKPHFFEANQKNVGEFNIAKKTYSEKIVNDKNLIESKIQNLYTNVGNDLIEIITNDSLRDILADSKRLSKSIQKLRKLPILNNEPDSKINIEILEALDILYYKRKIFTYSSCDYIEREFKKIPSILPQLHGIYMILSKIFNSDVLFHYTDNKRGDKKRVEYRCAKGFSSEWYTNLSRSFHIEDLPPPVTKNVKINRLHDINLIVELSIPIEILNVINILVNDIKTRINNDETFNSLLSFLKLNWIKSGKLSFENMDLLELNSQIIMNGSIDEDTLLKAHYIRPHQIVYEPIYLSLLEGITKWRLGMIDSEEVNSLSYNVLHTEIRIQIDNIIDNYHFEKSNRLKTDVDYDNRLRVHIDENKNWGTQVLKFVKQDESIVLDYVRKLKPFVLRKYASLPQYISDSYFIQLLKEFRNDNKILIGNQKKPDVSKIKKAPRLSSNINDEIIGYEDVKKDILKIVENILNPERLVKYDKKPPGGILFYGPPGCGKTYWANWIAIQIGFEFKEIKRSDFASSYVSGELQGLTELLDQVRKSKKRTLIFFDEFDDIGKKRGTDSVGHEENAKLVNNLLQEVTKLKDEGHLIIAATNFIANLDSALIRPGRFDTKVPIFPPLPEERSAILKYLLIDKNPENGLAHVFMENELNDDEYFEQLGIIMQLFSNSHVVLAAEKIKDGLIELEDENEEINSISLKKLVVSAIEESLSEVGNVTIEDYVKFVKDFSVSKSKKYDKRVNTLKHELNDYKDAAGSRVGFK